MILWDSKALVLNLLNEEVTLEIEKQMHVAQCLQQLALGHVKF